MVKKRRWLITFGPFCIPPGETANIAVDPQTEFKGTKLIVTVDDVHRIGLRGWLFKIWIKTIHFFSVATIGSKPACFISGLFVGNKAQLPLESNPISSNSFFPNVIDNELTLDKCVVGQQITLRVLNLSKTNTQIFAASLLGEVEFSVPVSAPTTAPI